MASALTNSQLQELICCIKEYVNGEISAAELNLRQIIGNLQGPTGRPGRDGTDGTDGTGNDGEPGPPGAVSPQILRFYGTGIAPLTVGAPIAIATPNYLVPYGSSLDTAVISLSSGLLNIAIPVGLGLPSFSQLLPALPTIPAGYTAWTVSDPILAISTSVALGSDFVFTLGTVTSTGPLTATFAPSPVTATAPGGIILGQTIVTGTGVGQFLPGQQLTVRVTSDALIAIAVGAIAEFTVNLRPT